MAFNSSYALANEICDGLGGLLDLSTGNSKDTSVFAPFLAGQEARHISIQAGQANSANTRSIG